jgi:hypothetical protein
MSKKTIKLNGQKVVLDMNRPKVQDLVAELIQACAERQFPIGMKLEHENGGVYVLSRIKLYNGSFRAYLIGTTGVHKGIARNSDKIVMVQEPKGGGTGRGYVTDLPARLDRFYDPDNVGEFIDI